MGKASGRARKRKLTLEYVMETLPPLTSITNAQERLHIVSTWLAAGMLSGSVGGAFVRATEVYLKALDSLVSKEIVDGLKQRLDEFEALLKRERKVL